MQNIYLFRILIFLLPVFQASAQCDVQVTQVTGVTCFGNNDGAINITPQNGTSPYTYNWSNGATVEDPVGLVAGIYTCTVTDALSCTATVSATVFQPSQLVANVPSQTLTCTLPQTSLTVTVSGGTPPYFYFWITGDNSNTTEVFMPGAYEVTVSDQNGCTATAFGIVSQDANIPISCVQPPPVLTCVSTSIQLSGACSSIGPNISFNWTTVNGHIISGANSLTPIIDEPGDYVLQVTNALNGCTSISSIVVNQDVAPPQVSAGPDLTLPCGGSVLTLVGTGSIGGNFTYTWSGPGILSGGNTANPIVNQPGNYAVTITNSVNGCTSSDQMQVISNGIGLCSHITGFVYTDTTANCLFDPGEPPLSGWVIRATGANNVYYAVTDNNGAYDVAVSSGDAYEMSAIPPGPAWVTCPPIAAVPVPNPNVTLPAGDLLVGKIPGCRQMSVDLTSGNLRRCFDNNFFSIRYCNIGTETVEDAYILVTLDPLLTPLSSSIPFTDLGNHVIRFDVGDVLIGECRNLNFLAHLDCGAVLGQTHCVEAHVYPDSICIPASAQWSGASLQVSSQCETDSVRFKIENIGIGNMPGPVDYIVIEDQVMLMNGSVQLDAGASTFVSFPANGSTWRMEVDQEPFHPGFSTPSVSVEGCTTSATFSTGFVTQFPADDGDDFIDILCVQNTASVDPNDKLAFPQGYGDEHYILPGTPLDYMIRFQNTGNDTAFNVRVVDTLSQWLDPATFRPGASSHPYTWDLKEAGILTFRFQNILLPDSNVNEAASHGFIKFNIQPKSDAPLGSVIYNSGAIYFDFNPPVITNTTYHRLGENFLSVGVWNPVSPGYRISAYPNPFESETRLEVSGLPDHNGLRLQVLDQQGTARVEMSSDNGMFTLRRAGLAPGFYYFRITQSGRVIGTGKLVVKG